jgi:Caspase domain
MKQTISLLLLAAALSFATGCATTSATLPAMRSEIPIASPDLSLKPHDESYSKLIIFNTSSKLLYGIDRNDLINIYLNGKGVTQLYMNQYVQVVVPRGNYKVDLVHNDVWNFSSSHTIEIDTPEAYLNIRATLTSNSAKLVRGLPDNFAKTFVPVSGEQVVAAADPPTPTPQLKRRRLTTGATMTPPRMSAINTKLAPKTEVAPTDNTVNSTPKPAEKDVLLKNKMRVTSQRWAVIIGLSNYKDTRIPPLRYASKDAKSFYDWAISPNGGKYPPSQVKLLMDNEATGRKIKDALYIWLKQALEEDVVAIYFAGHGSPESPDSPDNLYLLPYDTDYQNIASTGFPMWDIKTALKRFIKAKKVVVIADACHAGGVGQSFDVARRANRAIAVNPISSGLQNLSQIGDGVCVISASDDKQFSQESKDWGGGHGVFTYFLLEGLKGNADYNKDKNVTLGELIPYLSEQVRRATRNAQSPTVAGRFDPALSVGR